MKAEDIRKILGPQDTKEGVFFLKEIAAQFADMNERLDGFMASMVQLTKALNELNSQLRDPDPPAWWKAS